MTTVNSYLGNDPRRWRSGLGTYEAVSLGEVWPGVLVSLRLWPGDAPVAQITALRP